jgi:hypothetical protein
VRPRRSTPAAPAATLLAGPPTIRLRAGATGTAPVSTADGAGGAPLLPAVRATLEQSFRVDLAAVRVHTDTRAQKAARGLSARAFTYGNQIFLGPGERATDLGLMAHEVAHVVHQRGAAALQRWSPAHTDAFEDEARRASAAVLRGDPFDVGQRTGASRVQRLGLGDALNFFADKANLIPGYRMFTIILGVNPINGSRVERSAANILRALVEFIPGGALIEQALDQYGVFDKVGAWVEEQIRALGVVGGAIRQALDDFLKGLHLSDIFDLGGVWERAKRIFTDPIDRIIAFAKGLAGQILRFIREAILRPLAKLAEGTAGYDLLKAVLGEDPVTGDPVERSAETLIGGFMKLIGQEEVWQNIKKANAIGRAWAWFQDALGTLLGFLRQIPTLFVRALQSLTIEDIVLLPRAFAKVAGVFGDFAGKFVSWAGQAVWNLLEIILQAVAPGAIPYLKKTAAAFRTILKNPIGFVGDLVKAGKRGFQQFADNIGGHLKASFIEWLTGSLEGVYIPKALELREIVKFVLSVLGLTWQNVRQKLVKAVGEPVVKGLETAFDFVAALVREGPAAAWEKIKEQVGNLKDMVLQGIMDFVIETVAKKAVAKVASLLVPGGAFIQALISIYDTIMVFIDKLKKIIQVAMAFLDGIVAIVNGEIGGAANKVERTLAGLLTLAINFLAGFLGLGRIADKVMNIINTKVRAPIDKALDKVVDWIVSTARRLGKFVAQAGVPQDPNERVRLAAQAAVAAARRLTGRVTAGLLSSALQAIKLRYGLAALQPYEQSGTWWVRAAVNPTVNQDLGIVADSPAAQAAAWPVAVGDNIKVPESHLVEKVLSINPDGAITYSVTARGLPGKATMRYDRFKQLWDSNAIHRGGELSAAEMRAELTRLYGTAVADAIMKRGELATNLGVLNPEQAHHIIPVELLKKHGVLRLLVQSGWDFNAKVNGVPLAEGFHGHHPRYNDYVDKEITKWVAQHDPSKAADFRDYVENTLIPQLRAHINAAKSRFGPTDENLNDYFARL